ncbi:MAG: hypothetical protein ACO3NK_07490, partial [Prochlorotrichaceae cyanobacterium]
TSMVSWLSDYFVESGMLPLYFIELNPNGQWYWIEILTGMPMVKAMVKLIETLASEVQYLVNEAHALRTAVYATG